MKSTQNHSTKWIRIHQSVNISISIYISHYPYVMYMLFHYSTTLNLFVFVSWNSVNLTSSFFIALIMICDAHLYLFVVFLFTFDFTCVLVFNEYTICGHVIVACIHILLFFFALSPILIRSYLFIFFLIFSCSLIPMRYEHNIFSV